MNSNHKTSAFARFGLAFAVAAAAGAAMIPAAASARQGSTTTTTSQTSWSEDGNTVKVTTKDGKTEITVNGRTLPEGAESFTDEKSGITVTREGGQVTVSHNGRVVLGHSENAETPQVWSRRFSGAGPSEAPVVRGWTGSDGRDITVEVVRPKVMIGVTMDTVDRDGNTVTVLQRVLEGLPADRAGLEDGDIVVEVNGSASASPTDIRKAIQALSPGDSLRLTVEHDGERREVELTVDAFDPQQLGGPQAWTPSPGGPDQSFFFFDSDAAREDLETLRAEVTALTAELTARAQSLAGAAAADAQDLTRQITELTQELAAKSAELAQRAGEMAGPQMERLQGFLRHRWESLPNLRFESEDGAMQGFVVPAPAVPATPPIGPSTLDGRMERLNDRLDRLESLLERLIEEREQEDESR